MLSSLVLCAKLPAYKAEIVRHEPVKVAPVFSFLTVKQFLLHHRHLALRTGHT